MRSSITESVAATTSPLTLDAVKSHLKVTDNFQDKDIQDYIDAATAYAQEYQWSQLMTATFIERWDGFPYIITLSKNPALTVTTVQYVDSAGTTQTLTVTTDYVTDLNSKPARIVPAYSKSWPSSRGYIDDVIVTYTAGYGSTPESVPAHIRQALLMLVGHWFRNKEAVGSVGSEIAFSVKALLDLTSYRVFY